MTNNFKNIVVLFLLHIFCATSFAQTVSNISRSEVAEVFKKINNWLINTSEYSMTVTHISYEDYNTNAPSDKSVGFFKKQNQNYHSYLLGVHTIQNKNYKIIIDSTEKLILAANPDKLIWKNFSVTEYDSLLKICTSLKVTNKGEDKLYRIELSKNSTIGVYEFLVTDNFHLKEIVWYYNEEIAKDADDNNSPKSKPRLCIQFSNYNSKPQSDIVSEFDEKKYIVNNNGKLMLTTAYKTYKLLDQRFIK